MTDEEHHAIIAEIRAENSKTQAGMLQAARITAGAAFASAVTAGIAAGFPIIKWFLGY